MIGSVTVGTFTAKFNIVIPTPKDNCLYGFTEQIFAEAADAAMTAVWGSSLQVHDNNVRYAHITHEMKE